MFIRDIGLWFFFCVLFFREGKHACEQGLREGEGEGENLRQALCPASVRGSISQP